MNQVERRAQKLLAQKRRELEARVPRLRHRARNGPAPMPAPLSNEKFVILGSDEADAALRLPERPRLEHMHVIGTTGSGKTNLIEHLARQDILNGRGACVLDPHGGHPDSLYRRLATWLMNSTIAATRAVHLIDPNAAGFVTGFNPLAVPNGHDPAVVAEAALEAFQRLWADEDPDSKPTIQRVLSGTFTALAELGLTLAEARLLFDPQDEHGLREYVLGEVQDEYAQEELEWLHGMGGDRAGIRDLRAEVTGPRNRIAKLVRLEALRTIVGQTARAIDLRQALDRGDIILANLSGGAHTYEKGSDILGRLLVRFLLFHAKRRQRPDIPYFVYLDECQRYLSGDVPTLLAEVRKQGIGLVLAHQWQSQLAQMDEEILSAVRSGTNIKVVFRVKDQVEAADLAEMVIPLNLEQPVEVLVKETVVGHEVRRLQNASTGTSASRAVSAATTKTTGTGVTETEGTSKGRSTIRTESEQESFATTTGRSRSVAAGESDTRGTTRSHVESQADSYGEGSTVSSGTTRGRGGASSAQQGTSSGEHFAQSYDVPVDPWRSGEGAYGRAAAFGEASARNVTAGYDSGRSEVSGTSDAWSEGDSEAKAHSSQSSHSSSVANGIADSVTHGTSQVVTDTESESSTHGITRGVAIAKGVTEARSQSTARSRQESTGVTTGETETFGQTASAGWSEAMVPVMAMRASAVHGKENVLYKAAQMLRSLPTGMAFINFVDHTGMNSAVLRVPQRKMPLLSHEAFAALAENIQSRSPSAQPTAQAKEVVRARRVRLIKAAQQQRLPRSEPADAKGYRIPISKNESSSEGETDD
jgi:hypothetical protein